MEKELYLNQKEFEKIFKSHLKIISYSMSIKTLFSERLSKKIKYDPYYQRNYVWDRKKATFFIESIILGTDIPPLIFFNSNGKIEVIDGRQRFETIKRFKRNELTLSLQGLLKLPQLQKSTFNKLDPEIIDIFDSAKIRIFEFEVINEPQLDTIVEDKIKKEIFRRYNSGITPLNTSEIDNAKYDEDEITNYLRSQLQKNKALLKSIVDCFLGPRGQKSSSGIALVMQFLRKFMVLTKLPITSYATGNNRTEILQLYYDFLRENTDDIYSFCNSFLKKLEIVINVRENMSDEDIKNNKLIYECILWAVDIITKENGEDSIDFSRNDYHAIEKHYSENSRLYLDDNSFQYRPIIRRFQDTANFFEKEYDVCFSIYIKDTSFKNKIRELRQSETDAKLKIQELESLRANKPDPSVIPVDELINDLRTQKYLLRPSYQRQEKISIYKSSAIIESIILGINLPPIFIFKNEDKTKELVDGQQRLLSILGFLGKQYRDEKGNLFYTSNSNYSLSKLKILKEFNNKKFDDLDVDIQDKILDFKIQTIEIDSKLNPEFDPVDLFIRLNNKPYPIKENSFEMWNSFLEKDVIETIRTITDKHIDWFYIKVRQKDGTKDRMLNEEMITMLSYIAYKEEYLNSLGVYKREEKLNCRIKEKKSISVTLESLSVKEIEKRKFIESIRKVESFIENLNLLLNGSDQKDKLNRLFGLERKGKKGFRKRSLVDFYMLFLLYGSINNKHALKFSFDEVKLDLRKIQNLLRNTSNHPVDEDYLDSFIETLNELIEKYKNR